MSTGVKCCNCGQFVSHAAMIDGTAGYYHEPLNEYGPEVSEWFCADCIRKGVTP